MRIPSASTLWMDVIAKEDPKDCCCVFDANPGFFAVSAERVLLMKVSSLGRQPTPIGKGSLGIAPDKPKRRDVSSRSAEMPQVLLTWGDRSRRQRSPHLTKSRRISNSDEDWSRLSSRPAK